MDDPESSSSLSYVSPIGLAVTCEDSSSALSFGRECPEAAASESDPNDRLENALPSVVPSEDEMVLVLVFAFIFFAEVTLAGDTAASDESLGSESTES